jgi:hypothetical protein
MRYQLTGPWSCGQWEIPAGTIIDASALDGLMALIPNPNQPPWDAVALDNAAYSAMCQSYSPNRVRYGPNVTNVLTPGLFQIAGW